MALQINESTTTREGFSSPAIYLRLEVLYCRCGSRIEVESYAYASKSAFTSGSNTIQVNKKYTYDYNSSTDGSDITLFAHNQLLSALTTSQGQDGNGDPLPPQHDPNNVSIVDL